MRFRNNKYLEYSWRILLAIILGAVGSGVWQYILSPLFYSIGKMLFNIFSLCIGAFKDVLYMQIAEGLHESTSISLLFLINGIIIGFIIICVLFKRSKIRKIKSVDDVFCVFFLLSIIFVMLTGESYVNRAITYFEQSLEICAPYMSSYEILIIRSEFAQINNKDAYRKIISRLEDIANLNNITLREFDVW